MNKKGFTLIELLVVIGIIGILASVVLGSLNTARTKGADAAVKSNIVNLRTQASVYYDEPSSFSSYAGFCSTQKVTDTLNAVKVADSATSIGVNQAGGSGVITCNDTADGWAVEAPLKSPSFICIDTSGVVSSTTSSTLGAADDITCGP